jgi:hypothetical protein
MRWILLRNCKRTVGGTYTDNVHRLSRWKKKLLFFPRFGELLLFMFRKLHRLSVFSHRRDDIGNKDRVCCEYGSYSGVV